MEEAGIPTIYLGSCRDMMVRVMPPRSAFLNFPLGRQCGKPNDVDLQMNILRAALDLLVKASTPGEIVDLPFEWGYPFDWKSYMHDLDEMLKEEGIQVQEWTPEN
jgi:D-proline reductase (dithiol) PrdB